LPNPTDAAHNDWGSFNNGLADFELYSAAYDSTNNVVFASAQDNGSIGQSAPGGAAWNELFTGDGWVSQVDAAAPGGEVYRYVRDNNSSVKIQRLRFDAGNHAVNSDSVPITNVTIDSSGVATVTSNNHGLQSGDRVYVFGPLGVTALASPGNAFAVIGGGASDNLGQLSPQLQSLAFAGSTLVVGGLTGVYSMTGPGTWALFGTGLPNALVTSLSYDAKTGMLTAATFGRGAWTLSTPTAGGSLVYDASSKTLTGTGTNFQYSQATSADATGLHTTFTFILDGQTKTLTDAQVTSVVITGTGTGSVASLNTSDTYRGTDGQTHETQEEVILGGRAAQLYRVNAAGNGTLFLTLSGFAKEYATMGRADNGLVTGTTGPQNTLVSAGGYAYMTSGNDFYDISGAKYVYGVAVNSYDVAYHYDGSGPSALVISGIAYSFMLGTDHGQSFFNEAVGFQTNYGIAQHAGQDTAIFYDSPLNDVFVGNTNTSYMYADNADGSYAEFDYTQGFALVYA
jgi:hypothetical protein